MYGGSYGRSTCLLSVGSSGNIYVLVPQEVSMVNCLGVFPYRGSICLWLPPIPVVIKNFREAVPLPLWLRTSLIESFYFLLPRLSSAAGRHLLAGLFGSHHGLIPASSIYKYCRPQPIHLLRNSSFLLSCLREYYVTLIIQSVLVSHSVG